MKSTVLAATASLSAVFALAGSSHATPACGAVLTASTVLDGDMSCPGRALNVGASDVTLDCAGHSIVYDTQNTGCCGWQGLMVDGYDRFTLKNCNVVHGQRQQGGIYATGLVLANGSGHTVVDNTFHMVGEHAINLSRSHSNRIVGNAFYTESAQSGHGGDGFDIGGSNDNVVADNLIVSSRSGFALYDSYRNVLSGNLIEVRGAGVEIYGGGEHILEGNTLVGTLGDYQYLLLVRNSSNNLLTGNEVRSGTFGAHLSNPMPSYCVWNPWSWECRVDASTGNVYEGNQFLDNTTHVENPGCATGTTFRRNRFEGGAIHDACSPYQDNTYSQCTPPEQEEGGAAGLVAELSANLAALGLPANTAGPMLAMLDAAAASLAGEHYQAAAGKLSALANHAAAQRGKKLTPAQADAIIAAATATLAALP